MNIKLISEILLFALIPFATMLLGGVFGSFFAVKSKIRTTLLHLAAGVIFAVVTIELSPKIVARHNILETSIGFFLGVCIMLIIKYFTEKSEKKHKKLITTESSISKTKVLLPWGLLIGVAVDISLDGILLGVGFAAGKSEGLLLCIALSLEILVLGLVVSTELKAEKFRKKIIIATVSILSACIVVGAFIGSVILNIVNENILTGILAFGLSALIYLVTEELLVEAHENNDTPFSTAIFFVGFFIFLLIALVY